MATIDQRVGELSFTINDSNVVSSYGISLDRIIISVLVFDMLHIFFILSNLMIRLALR